MTREDEPRLRVLFHAHVGYTAAVPIGPLRDRLKEHGIGLDLQAAQTMVTVGTQSAGGLLGVRVLEQMRTTPGETLGRLEFVVSPRRESPFDAPWVDPGPTIAVGYIHPESGRLLASWKLLEPRRVSAGLGGRPLAFEGLIAVE